MVASVDSRCPLQSVDRKSFHSGYRKMRIDWTLVRDHTRFQMELFPGAAFAGFPDQNANPRWLRRSAWNQRIEGRPQIDPYS